jgi:hypothetical protein
VITGRRSRLEMCGVWRRRQRPDGALRRGKLRFAAGNKKGSASGAPSLKIGAMPIYFFFFLAAAFFAGAFFLATAFFFTAFFAAGMGTSQLQNMAGAVCAHR